MYCGSCCVCYETGKLWIKQMLLSSLLLPVLVCGTAFFINFIAIGYHASRAIPFSSMVRSVSLSDVRCIVKVTATIFWCCKCCKWMIVERGNYSVAITILVVGWQIFLLYTLVALVQCCDTVSSGKYIYHQSIKIKFCNLTLSSMRL